MMADKVVAGPISDACGVREAVCVHTGKIYASCQDKDCVEDLRVFPTESSLSVLQAAQAVRASRAELLSVVPIVEPVHFNRGFYTVDMTFYYRVVLQASASGTVRFTELDGLSVFNKRIILYGGELGAKSFSSAASEPVVLSGRGVPTAVVEALDPMILAAQRVDCPGDERCEDTSVPAVPTAISAAFDSPLSLDGSAAVRAYVSLGQFSVVRLERDATLLIPTYDYCPPQCECSDADIGGGSEDPCALFDGVRFPTEQFFPSSCMR